MSNIQTSYIRVFRKDAQYFNEEEIDNIFNLAVRSCGEFGSYWVRIQKKYRPEERCLDIQFGSGKRYHSGNLLESYEIFNHYYVWERFADEGGFADTIFSLEENVAGQYIDRTDAAECLYRFDKLKINSERMLTCFDGIQAVQLSPTEYELALSGDYCASNSRSFVDLVENSDYYGPRLQYDANYESDYSELINDSHLASSNTKFIRDFFVYPYPSLENGDKLSLYWKGRVVQSIEKLNDNEPICQAADYWDNCADPAYLNFLSEKLLKKL
jgi:hypothetical protein